MPSAFTPWVCQYPFEKDTWRVQEGQNNNKKKKIEGKRGGKINAHNNPQSFRVFYLINKS